MSFNVWSFLVTWKEILDHVKNLWLHVWHRLTFFQKDIFHINVIYVDRTIKIYWPWYYFCMYTESSPMDLGCVFYSTSNIYTSVFILDFNQTQISDFPSYIIKWSNALEELKGHKGKKRNQDQITMCNQNTNWNREVISLRLPSSWVGPLMCDFD